MKQISFLFCLLVLFSCKQTGKDIFLEKLVSGETMGTTYSIKFISSPDQVFPTKEQIDSTLVSINNAVSTYEPNSTISRLNKANEDGITIQANNYPDQHFIVNYFTSVEIHKQTEGMFDPSVMPLVNYWGFGYEGKNPVTQVDTSKISQLLEHVGLDSFVANPTRKNIHFTKTNASSTLDFSAIAKGYAVQYLSTYLESFGLHSYMVEIGGEVKVKGKNNKDQYWKLGINTPEETANYNDIQLIVSPKDKALASSGNYRIFHKLNDVSYGHEINPITGFPQVTDILSASVIHDNCMYADAYATAFMIMGLDKSLEFINYNHDIEACFIIKEDGQLKNVYSKGFEQYLVH